MIRTPISEVDSKPHSNSLSSVQTFALDFDVSETMMRLAMCSRLLWTSNSTTNNEPPTPHAHSERDGWIDETVEWCEQRWVVATDGKLEAVTTLAVVVCFLSLHSFSFYSLLVRIVFFSTSHDLIFSLLAQTFLAAGNLLHLLLMMTGFGTMLRILIVENSFRFQREFCSKMDGSSLAAESCLMAACCRSSNLEMLDFGSWLGLYFMNCARYGLHFLWMWASC
ncbi:hypothetical protein Droror1_Dr00004147 [Drosera rotundifolia]